VLPATPTIQAAVQAVQAAARAPGSVIAANLPFLLSGLATTARLAVLALILALILGIIFGILRVSPFRPLRWLASMYVEFVRNTPLLVQTFFAYFGLPTLGIRLPGFSAAFIALGVYTGAFVAEVVRAGILAISRGQVEAARSLGLSYTQTMRYVVLPQAFATMIPPLGNLVIAMTKNTSLASVVAVPDIMYNGNIVNSRTFATYEVYTFLGVLYLSLTIPLSFAVNYLERRLTRFRR
jgi:aspartate/glutamate/glutamine transport system permease protein